jgi:outer membrane protein OmpA-like peptidoglycan-associated protein
MASDMSNEDDQAVLPVRTAEISEHARDQLQAAEEEQPAHHDAPNNSFGSGSETLELDRWRPTLNTAHLDALRHRSELSEYDARRISDESHKRLWWRPVLTFAAVVIAAVVIAGIGVLLRERRNSTEFQSTLETTPRTSTAVMHADVAASRVNRLPVVARYSDDRIVLMGAVADVAVKEAVEAVATAIAPRGYAIVDVLLTVDPTVSRDVRIRVVEPTSVSFRRGSTQIAPFQAAWLNRVASAMKTFPRTVLIVIGHGDDRPGVRASNTLAARRADTVVTYLSKHGIPRNRLESRAARRTDYAATAPASQSAGRLDFEITGVR